MKKNSQLFSFQGRALRVCKACQDHKPHISFSSVQKTPQGSGVTGQELDFSLVNSPKNKNNT